MRVWALALTRNATAADDLVQDVALKTLIASDSFVSGTNFSAWVHRIMVNHFISAVRRNGKNNNIEQIPEIAIAASQQNRTDLREVSCAFQRLPEDQKHALRSIAAYSFCCLAVVVSTVTARAATAVEAWEEY